MAVPAEKQTAFVVELVGSGCTPTEAARRAGYACPAQEAYRLVRLEHVQDAIREEQQRIINGDLVNKSLKTLHAVMDDPAAPASAKVAAARAGLEAAGLFARANSEGKAQGEREGSGGKPLHAMTEEELLQLALRMREQREALEKVGPMLETGSAAI